MKAASLLASAHAAANKAANKALEHAMPTPSFSIADLVDEVRSLREQKAALEGEKSLLESHVGLLSQQLMLPPGERTVTEAPDTGASKPPKSPDAESAEPSDESSVEQLSAVRAALDAEADAGIAATLALGSEIRAAEADAEASRRRVASAEEELRRSVEELEAELERLAARERRAVASAVSAERRRAAQATASLEEALGAAQDALARREEALDLDGGGGYGGGYGGGGGVDQERQLRAEWMAKCEHHRARSTALQEEVAALQAVHDDELRRERSRAEGAEGRLAQAEAAARAAGATRAQAERQAAQLSLDFNAQVHELALLRQRAERAEQQLSRHTVEKCTARQWIVNFVENEAARPELLRLMATWWEFSEEDLVRVGLRAEALPPSPFRRPSDGSLLDAFESFLTRESGVE